MGCNRLMTLLIKPMEMITMIITITLITTIMAGLLFGFAGEGLALPVWPVTADSNNKPVTDDRIGYEDGSHQEFKDFSLDPNFNPNTVIEYRVGEDAWSRFPCRLNTKNHTPNTVRILFKMDTAAADAQSLVLAAKTDAWTGQYLGVFLDGRPIHRPGGEEIQPASSSQGNGFQEYQEYTFWLGYMARGEHNITLSNETDPNSQIKSDTNFGILFDYIKLVHGAKVGISLAPGAGSTAVMTGFTVLGENDPAVSGPMLPRAHFYAGFWRLQITGLEPGAGVKVEIHCPPESFFALQEYYTHDGAGPEYGWEAMKIAKDTASSTVVVELSDGGAGDTDLTRDGSISHIGGIAVPFSLGEGYDYQGCFIFSLKQKQNLLLLMWHKGARHVVVFSLCLCAFVPILFNR